MTRHWSPRLHAYAVLAALALLLGAGLQRPELVALATPLALALLVGVAVAGAPELRAEASIDDVELVEGETTHLRVQAAASQRLDRLEAVVEPEPCLTAADPHGCAGVGAVAATAPAERSVELAVPLEAARWGLPRRPAVVLRWRDVAGLATVEQRLPPGPRLRVRPALEPLPQLVRPADVAALAGGERSRASGSGIEVAELRPWQPGDRLRDVSWRASARRGGHWVVTRHPERNADVVLLVDDVPDRATAVVRAAASLAQGHLAARDRVGLLGAGGTLRWVRPGAGRRQAERLTDALLHADSDDRRARLPIAPEDLAAAGVLPSRALVLAVTTYTDATARAAIHALHGRRADLALLAVDLPADRSGPGAPGEHGERSERVAARVRAGEREAELVRLGAGGTAVARWDGSEPLAGPVAELAQRRGAVRQLPAGLA